MSGLEFLSDPDRNCAGLPINLFFPRSGGSNGAEARRVCHGCPVQNACLEYAIENPQYGIWGGTSRKERAQIARERGLAYNVNRTAQVLGGSTNNKTAVERLTAKGWSSGQIAEHLGITPRTVTRHRTGNWGQAAAS